MQGRLSLYALIAITCTSCDNQSASLGREAHQSPDWRRYQAAAVTLPTGPNEPLRQYRPTQEDRFSFRDLKSESDESLARRLLGQAGRRIAYIDRHRERWRLYNGDDDGAESVDLYTHAFTWGTQYGLCVVERYAIEFDEGGRIESVNVSQRYGVEGPIFQTGYDQEQRSRMCALAPPTHAPSYFPAPGSIAAYDAARLLIVVFDRAASPGPLSFPLRCRTQAGRDCAQNLRAFLGGTRLGDIDEFSHVNCPLRASPTGSVCFTIMMGRHRIGPFPNYITVRGSSVGDRIRIDSVEILESFRES